MKKMLTIILSALLIVSAGGVCASAKEYTEDELINMTDAGELLDAPDEEPLDDDGDSEDNDDIDDNDDDDDSEPEMPTTGYDDSTNTYAVTISIPEATPKYVVYNIDQEDITRDLIKETYVTIGSKRYDGSYISSYSNDTETINTGVIVKANYSAKIGEYVTVHFVMIDGTDIAEIEEVEEGEDEVCIEECDIHHAIFYYTSDTDKLTSLEIKVNGKKVSYSEYDGDDVEDYDLDNYEYGYVYQAKYKTSYKAKVTVTAKTEKGYTYTDTAYAQDIKPTITLDPFTAGDTILSGKTKAKSTVTIKAAGKTYKTKANSNGAFSKKIKAVKSGKKVTVTVKTTTNRSATKSFTVAKTKGTAKITSKLNSKAKSVKVKLTNAKKDDVVKLNIAGKKYTKKVKAAKSSTTITIKISTPKKGAKVQLSYTDAFGTKKATATTKVK